MDDVRNELAWVGVPMVIEIYSPRNAIVRSVAVGPSVAAGQRLCEFEFPELEIARTRVRLALSALQRESILYSDDAHRRALNQIDREIEMHDAYSQYVGAALEMVEASEQRPEVVIRQYRAEQVEARANLADARDAREIFLEVSKIERENYIESLELVRQELSQLEAIISQNYIESPIAGVLSVRAAEDTLVAEGVLLFKIEEE